MQERGLLSQRNCSYSADGNETVGHVVQSLGRIAAVPLPNAFEDFCGCLYETIQHDNTGSLAITVNSEEKLEDSQ